jgi:hypothetical protein
MSSNFFQKIKAYKKLYFKTHSMCNEWHKKREKLNAQNTID